MSIGRPSSTALRNLLILIASVTSGIAQAQNQSETYYVVVGGFAVHKNAERFTEQVLTRNYPARYAFNPVRNLYYVYVQVTADPQRARQLAYRLRLESEFTGTWIYQGPLEGNTAIEAQAIAEYDAETGAGPLPSEGAAPGNEAGPSPNVIATNQSGPPAAEAGATDPAGSTVAARPAIETTPAKPAGKEFIFRLTTGADNTAVSGPVYLMQEAGTQPQRIASDEKVIIPPPTSGKVTIVCHVVGYKLAKRTIPYDNPGAAGERVIPIKLVPVAPGDYIELENVKFFDHTAIFTPASEDELLQLVNLMGNPRFRVRLYGHTHSNERGDITTLGTTTNFFAPDPATNATSHGSGKELSRLRAEAVKAYLVSKGIDAARISTKGYGAQLAVYEQAAANDRIEVEILKN
ncbi:OmpA family protein [Parachryseolinea silvisoli]|uniref:OmpA family protein n=1 Tax=Parachryseolinea silvisoli TaxID=2873601 RepID=UPI0022659F0B|nr:OmpA family protein [Parachryseolinea silvisoli]MCD9019691.1 OmpA family protein [Parachryseolinea silvisoli]